jgi:uncharacterized protein YhfF
MWRAHRAATPGPLPPEEDPWVGRFGDSAAMATELLELVLAGTKRATVGLVRDSADDGEPLPRIGGHWVACDGDGTPRCVLRTVALRLGPLASVDDAFAWDEGEGDRTRAGWIAAHLAFFRRTCAARGRDWSDELELVFERFRVVWPPEVADAPQAPPGPASAP